jgi:hypothetical protein
MRYIRWYVALYCFYGLPGEVIKMCKPHARLFSYV